MPIATAGEARYTAMASISIDSPNLWAGAGTHRLYFVNNKKTTEVM
ncbi:MAG: hypothetical protein JW864_06770 [Spirochaetes bacterium]|nr:hypothetical protein [Spirochaetota bacterium]